MRTYTFGQVLTALRLPRPRVDQWIARGQFKVKETSPGVARQWDFGDVMRLAVFAKIVAARDEITATKIGGLTHLLHGFKDDQAVLVLWSGLIPTTISDGKGGVLKSDQPGIWSPEIIRHRELANFLLRDDVRMAFFIKLDEVESQVKAKLARVSSLPL